MSDTVWVINMYGSDGPWNRHSWADVEDDIRYACKQTVRDCEQEINDGGHWSTDEACEAMEDELADEVLAKVNRELQTRGTAYVKVEPWYAVNQRCTWSVTVRETTQEEMYGEGSANATS